MEKGSKITPNIEWYFKNKDKNEYDITTAEELAGLAELVNDKNIDFAGKTVKLGNDIHLNNAEWIPIGTKAKPFNGTFDGNNHIISGVYIKDSNTCQGLFGYIGSSGEIKNLKIKDSCIEGDNYVGGLAGINKGKISKSCYEGKVMGRNYVGGLVGANEGIISNSYSNSTVTGNCNDGEVGGIGGLVGENWGKIDNCYSSGKVTGKENVGGLVGKNNNRYEENTSNENSNKNKHQNDGFLGKKSLTWINNSYYDKEISDQNDSGKGEGKTTAEMKQKDTFVKWNFDTIWNLNNNYPYLRDRQ